MVFMVVWSGNISSLEIRFGRATLAASVPVTRGSADKRVRSFLIAYRGVRSVARQNQRVVRQCE